MNIILLFRTLRFKKSLSQKYCNNIKYIRLTSINLKTHTISCRKLSYYKTKYLLFKAIPTIVTTPIVFGENVTFKCLYNPPTSSYLSTMWLKGKEKVAIAYGNISTDETKYSSSLKNEGSQLTYLLNVHSVSCTDLSTYRCEFNFVGANLTFNMNQRLSFICEYYLFLFISARSKRIICRNTKPNKTHYIDSK